MSDTGDKPYDQSQDAVIEFFKVLGTAEADPTANTVMARLKAIADGGAGRVLTPLGYSQITTLSTADDLGTVPPGTTVALIQAEGQNIRWRDDGSNPTASVGTQLGAGASFWYYGAFAAFKVIEEVASAKINVSFYQEGA